jgi:hypothetical protein
MTINCYCCSNTRKIEFEGHIEDCPVCEEYVWLEAQRRGKHELENTNNEQQAVQSNTPRNVKRVGKKDKRH